jgi:hypothetical protein
MTELSEDSQCLGRDSNRIYLEYPLFETALKFVTLYVITIYFIQMNVYINNIYFLNNSNDIF